MSALSSKLIHCGLLFFTTVCILKAGDLGLSTDPSLIDINGDRYVIANADDTVTFYVSPADTLTTLTWSFVDGSPATGIGTDPQTVTYTKSNALDQECPVTIHAVRTDQNGATCTTKSKTTCTVVVPAIQIYTPNMSDFENVDSSNGKIIVGEQVNLYIDIPDSKGVLKPEAKYKWVLPDDAIISFNQTASYFPLTSIAASGSDSDGDSMTIYFTGDAGERDVTCQLTIDGVEQDITAKLNLVRPTVDATTSTYTYVSIINHSDGSARVEFDNPSDNTRTGNGINFYAQNLQIPQGFSGTAVWSQTIVSTKLTQGANVHTYTNMEDGHWPYGSGIPYLNGVRDSDSPGSDLPARAPSPQGRDDNFKMYYMFLPSLSNSIYVPLKSVAWQWGFTAMGIASPQTGSKWILTSSPSYHSNNPSFSDETAEPNWTIINP